jgi:hypothetical protein
VGHKHVADGYRRLIVLVQALEVALEVSVFRQPQGGQYHRDTEGDETEPPDGGDDGVTVLVVKRQLGVGEAAVEVLFLVFGQGEAKVLAGIENVVQVLHLGSEFQKEFVLGDLVLVGEGTEPDEFGLQAVKREPREQAVLGIGDERENLVRSAGKQGGQLGLLDEHALAVLASGERDVFVVESLAEAVGILAVVGRKDIGEGVALALEHHPFASVVVQDLIDHRGAAVGRDVVHQHRRLLRNLKPGFVLGGLEFLHLLLILLLLIVTLLVQRIVDGLREVPAERKPAFTCRGSGGHEKEEVGVDSPSVVYAGDVRETGRKDAEGAEDEHIAVFVRVGFGRDGVEQRRQPVPDRRGEDRERRLPVIVGRLLRRIRSFRNMRRRCVCGFRAFCGSCAYALVGVKRNARFLGLVEERVEGHTGSVRPQTLVVLLVGVPLVIVRVESAYAMEEVPTVLPELVGKGETYVAPVVVARGDVDVTRFKSLDNDFYIIGPVAGIDDRG